MRKFTNCKYHFKLLIIFCFVLLTTQCGAQPSPAQLPVSDGITTQVSFQPESIPENKLVDKEIIPLNNCNGNSVLKMDVERSREFEQAVIDKNGRKFGGEYVFLTGLLEKEYSVRTGETEIQKHKVHLETEANSFVKYTIAWKETWLNGQAIVKRENMEQNVPFRVKKGLTLEVLGAEDIICP